MLQKASVGIPAQRAASPERTERAARQSSQPHTWTWAGLTALAVLAVIATAALAANRPNGTSPSSTPPSSFTNPSTVISRAAGVMNCERQPAAATIVEAGRPGPPDETNPLVAPYTWFGTPGSWFLGVHEGWQTWKDGDVTCFSDTRGRVLAVDPNRPYTRDPMQAAKAEEKRLRDADLLPAYHLVNLKGLTITAPAAEWEFTYEEEGVPRHVFAMIIPRKPATFVVYWATDEVDTIPSRPGYDIVRGTFHGGPPPGQGPPFDPHSPPPPKPNSPPPPRS
jgi:hypothetical protein